MKIIQGVSHLDHNLTAGQLAFIKERFQEREGFFIETFELPKELGTVECILVGPMVGMRPISEDDVEYMVRGNRKTASRMWLGPVNGNHFIQPTLPLRGIPTKPAARVITVIAGPHKVTCGCKLSGRRDCIECEGHGDVNETVLYTAYGGPCAPREPGDPNIKSWDELLESRKFWAEHALVG